MEKRAARECLEDRNTNCGPIQQLPHMNTTGARSTSLDIHGDELAAKLRFVFDFVKEKTNKEINGGFPKDFLFPPNHTSATGTFPLERNKGILCSKHL
jgi:hypothetical protein